MKDKRRYVRVSTPKQAQEGESINIQNYDLGKEGFRKYYEDGGKSAYFSEEKIDFELTEDYFVAKFRIDVRPDFKRMLEDAMKEDFELGVWKWDRFARDSAFQKLTLRFLKKHGVEVTPIKDTKDELGREVMGMMSQRESKKTSERIKSNYEFKWKHGLPTTNHQKKGYRWSDEPYVINKIGYKHLVKCKDKKERQMILDVFSGKDYKEIRAKYGLHPQTYYNIKKDKFYCGYVEFEGKYNKGIHEPYITEEEWKKIQ